MMILRTSATLSLIVASGSGFSIGTTNTARRIATVCLSAQESTTPIEEVIDLQSLFNDADLEDDGEWVAEEEETSDMRRAMRAMQREIARESRFNHMDELVRPGLPNKFTESEGEDASSGSEGPVGADAALLQLHTSIANEVATLIPEVGVVPSHELVDLTPGGIPAFLETEDMVYVDEPNCIGCGLCAALAPSTFMMEDVTGKGNGRVFEQGTASRELIEEAKESCPSRCIHTVSWEELTALETLRDSDNWRGRDWAGARARPEAYRSGVLCAHCYGTHTNTQKVPEGKPAVDATTGIAALVDSTCDTKKTTCPAAGCYNCPVYKWIGPGANPVYQARATEQAIERAEFQKSEARGLAEWTSVDL